MQVGVADDLKGPQCNNWSIVITAHITYAIEDKIHASTHNALLVINATPTEHNDNYGANVKNLRK